jgi:hypothetical protein
MEPDTINDEVFGALGYDPPLEEWYARVVLHPEREIDVTIWWTETKDGTFRPILERTREAFLRFQRHETEHRLALATDMLRRYRDSARIDMELPEADEFVKSLAVTKMAFASDGSATVDYDDLTELFGDHSIVADIRADGVFDGFSLHG